MEGLGELISKISKVWGSFIAKVGKIARMQCMTAPLLKLLRIGLETSNQFKNDRKLEIIYEGGPKIYGWPLKTTLWKYPIAAIGYLGKKDQFVHHDFWILWMAPQNYVLRISNSSYWISSKKGPVCAPWLLDKFKLYWTSTEICGFFKWKKGSTVCGIS